MGLFGKTQQANPKEMVRFKKERNFFLKIDQEREKV